VLELVVGAFQAHVGVRFHCPNLYKVITGKMTFMWEEVLPEEHKNGITLPFVKDFRLLQKLYQQSFRAKK